MSNGTNEVRLFEVNLISDQVSKLLRRRTFQQISGAATLLMMAAGTALAILMAAHLSDAMRRRTEAQRNMSDYEGMKQSCARLDAQKASATRLADTVAPLLPIARQRIAWGPKLTAVAAALPPDTGLVRIQASQRDLFVVRTATSAPRQQDQAAMPQMTITILHAPLTGGALDPGLFAESLAKDETFMRKFDSVHLVTIEPDSWGSKQLEFLRYQAQGTPK